ncbi:O-antigen ligase family protein [Qipengyuania flava]|uniref:O-antigen ligase family protein n=1 Tax=Qipengyuania flava TaxID=192812 RepID=UPI001C62CB63|nr:O-antigen ligase family protein [Qipengyuania flava]QYJ06373.1 O-antigen ligase family protein [Qipengyuania flava]
MGASGRKAARAFSLGEMASLTWPFCALIVLIFLLGGGGSRYGILNGILQVSALGFGLFYFDRMVAGWRSLPLVLRGLIAATLAVPLIQLVPLPPAVWQALPSADLALPARALVGAEAGWYPWSLDPARTALAAFALIPPLVLLLYARSLGAVAYPIMALVVALAFVSMLVALIQIAGGSNPLPYPILEPGRLYGVFASHNSSGLMFVLAQCCLIPFWSSSPAGVLTKPLLVSLAAVLVLAVVLTQSRSSIALLLVPFSAFGLRLLLARKSEGRAMRWPVVVLGLALVGGILAAVASSDRVGATISRFENLEDQRPNIWEDSKLAIEDLWPMGSGMGSFDEVFQTYESLETLLPGFARRAHNDYLELGVEAGILGWLLLLAWTVYLVLQYWKRRSGPDAPIVLAASMGLLIFALQSLVDYPLRNEIHLSLAALLIAVLAPTYSRTGDRDFYEA